MVKEKSQKTGRDTRLKRQRDPGRYIKYLKKKLFKYAAYALLVVIFLPALMLSLYRVVPPPMTPLMIIRWAQDDAAITRDWRPLEDIATGLQKAVIAAEDNFFCTHNGFDWKSLRSSVENTLAGKRTRGASTISMQTAKNLFLWPSRSYLRKGLEAYLTFHLELILDKSRTLELYLNIAEWGDGIYGAEAAAQQYFNKRAADLNLREATLLAATLPNPRVWSPSDPSPSVLAKAAIYRQRLQQLGPLLDCVRE